LTLTFRHGLFLLLFIAHFQIRKLENPAKNKSDPEAYVVVIIATFVVQVQVEQPGIGTIVPIAAADGNPDILQARPILHFLSIPQAFSLSRLTVWIKFHIASVSNIEDLWRF